ncbi:galactokinase [Altererythrobacter sp. MF3-039]|uniref:galactokinase n=1 Tax=Altererythrobacter sp. MF3-039 TaxID=3252901 RepID=UPI00390C9DE3
MPGTGKAPGRVNLIGEHIDYNGGMVLPSALACGLQVTLEPRPDRQIEIKANDYGDFAHRSLDDAENGHWSDTAVGAIKEAATLGLLRAGAELTIHSSIPQGSGLSSSAALIVAILKAARDLAGVGPDDVELAIAARRVENEFMGVPCGIMDQMAVALASPGTAMALDTKSLEYRLVELPSDHDMVVIHSGLTRKLTDGRYAERKAECDAAKAYFDTDDLCHLALDQVEDADLPEAVKRRARHCVTEHARVLAAVDALEGADTTLFGALMAQSHLSMRDDFEVSLPAIDRLVDCAIELGAVGARLTGGGFGGCIVACVGRDKREAWQAELLARHTDARFIDAVSG